MIETHIALVGDFNPNVLAHRAIDRCFELARQSHSESIAPEWISTDRIVLGDEAMLQGFRGIWCTPASPYRNTQAALWAIQYARTHGVAFLGTCGGYQHALLEYARNVLRLAQAGHTELDPAVSLPLLERMQCSLIEKSQKVIITSDAFQLFYAGDSGVEGFHCSYGLNPDYEQVFNGALLEIVARSEEGQARAFQLKGHPFFVGTQFQPERRALEGTIHPLVESFFAHARSQVPAPLTNLHSPLSASTPGISAKCSRR
jgi:CTP synthase (UTP-ammonia lyase)